MDPTLTLIGALMLVISIVLSPLSSRVGMPVLLIFLVSAAESPSEDTISFFFSIQKVVVLLLIKLVVILQKKII